MVFWCFLNYLENGSEERCRRSKVAPLTADGADDVRGFYMATSSNTPTTPATLTTATSTTWSSGCIKIESDFQSQIRKRTCSFSLIFFYSFSLKKKLKLKTKTKD